jgi:hypothetical protein
MTLANDLSYGRDRHFNAASSFQIGVSRGLRTCSRGMLASVSQRWHLTCSQPIAAIEALTDRW